MNTPLTFGKYYTMDCDIFEVAHSNLFRIAVEFDLGNISYEVYNMLQQKEFALLTDRIGHAQRNTTR